tara:strand:+ start:184 stop:1029 length:846 start_codon:yes stop_codon:yes gene_type:complete
VFYFCSQSAFSKHENKERPVAELKKQMEIYDKKFNIFHHQNLEFDIDEHIDFSNKTLEIILENPSVIYQIENEKLVSFFKSTSHYQSSNIVLEQKLSNLFNENIEFIICYLLKIIVGQNNKLENIVKSKSIDPDTFWGYQRQENDVLFFINFSSNYIVEKNNKFIFEEISHASSFRIILMLNFFMNHVKIWQQEIEPKLDEKNSMMNMTQKLDFDYYGRYAISGSIIKQQIKKQSSTKIKLTLYNKILTSILKSIEESSFQEVMKSKGLINYIISLQRQKG